MHGSESAEPLPFIQVRRITCIIYHSAESGARRSSTTTVLLQKFDEFFFPFLFFFHFILIPVLKNVGNEKRVQESGVYLY